MFTLPQLENGPSLHEHWATTPGVIVPLARPLGVAIICPPPTQCSLSGSFSSPLSHTCPVSGLIPLLSPQTLTALQFTPPASDSPWNPRLICLAVCLHLQPGVYTASQMQCAFKSSPVRLPADPELSPAQSVTRKNQSFHVLSSKLRLVRPSHLLHIQTALLSSLFLASVSVLGPLTTSWTTSWPPDYPHLSFGTPSSLFCQTRLIETFFSS